MTDSMTQDKEYTTTDQGFAAYLMTKFMFLEAIDTGQLHGKHAKYTTKKLLFLIPEGEDMDQHHFDYIHGTDNSLIPAKVMFEKMRLIRQYCRKPYSEQELNNARKV